MHTGAHVGQIVANFLIRHVKFFQELTRHIEERLLGPGTEPVERAAVDEGGETTAPDSEELTDG